MNSTIAFEREREEYLRSMREGERQGVVIAGPVFEDNRGTSVTYKGHNTLVFSSNNYLGLSNHPQVISVMKDALDKYGASMCGSRMHNGTTSLHKELEERLANALGSEDAVIFSSGYLANLAAVQGVSQDDKFVVVTDALNHASINAGIKISNAKKKIYSHNNMEKLEYILNKNKNSPKKMIMVDGIFSMSGERAKLVEIIHLAEKYNAMVMVDEAHSFGIFGQKGHGLCDELGISNRVEMKMVTFSKALGGVGGCITGSKELCDYMRFAANAYLFTVALNPASVAGVLKSLELLETEEWRREKLWDNARYFINQASEIGFQVDCTDSPIIPIKVGDYVQTIRYTDALLKRGLYVSNAVYPVVPKNESILRISISTALDKKELDKGLEIMRVTAKEFDII